jgi:hypothetical protein
VRNELQGSGRCLSLTRCVVEEERVEVPSNDVDPEWVGCGA